MKYLYGAELDTPNETVAARLVFQADVEVTVTVLWAAKCISLAARIDNSPEPNLVWVLGGRLDNYVKAISAWMTCAVVAPDAETFLDMLKTLTQPSGEHTSESFLEAQTADMQDVVRAIMADRPLGILEVVRTTARTGEDLSGMLSKLERLVSLPENTPPSGYFMTHPE